MNCRRRRPRATSSSTVSTSDQPSATETGLITGHAGVPGLIGAFRQTGTAAVIVLARKAILYVRQSSAHQGSAQPREPGAAVRHAGSAWCGLILSGITAPSRRA